MEPLQTYFVLRCDWKGNHLLKLPSWAWSQPFLPLFFNEIRRSPTLCRVCRVASELSKKKISCISLIHTYWTPLKTYWYHNFWLRNSEGPTLTISELVKLWLNTEIYFSRLWTWAKTSQRQMLWASRIMMTEVTTIILKPTVFQDSNEPCVCKIRLQTFLSQVKHSVIMKNRRLRYFTFLIKIVGKMFEASGLFLRKKIR